jgi:hypothetical protein
MGLLSQVLLGQVLLKQSGGISSSFGGQSQLSG